MRFIALGDAAKIDRSVASEDECLRLPYVGLEHIEKDRGHFVADFRKKPESLLATKFKFTSEHILYGKLRPYLNKVALPNFDGVCTTEILPLLPRSDCLIRGYLYAVLLSPKFVAWASANVSGANLPRLDPTRLAEFQIPLVPIEKQKRIALIIEEAERLRRIRRYAQQLSDTFLQSVFSEMFGKESNFNSVELEALFSEKPKNGLYLHADKYGSGTPIIRINNFYSGTLNSPITFKRAQAEQSEIKEFAVENGDILINRVNSLEYLGKCAYVQGIVEPTVYESNMMRIRVKSTEVSAIYLVKYLSSSKAKAQIMQRSRKAVNQASINQTDVETLKIPLPPLPLQEKFASTAQRFERLHAQQRESTRQVEHLFQTLLHRAFRGEL